jgi:hypothetical protein
MVDALVRPGLAPDRIPREVASQPPPDLVDWIESGRLTLLDAQREPIGVDCWARLPADVRERAIEEFHRIVRGRTKAAVLFLR